MTYIVLHNPDDEASRLWLAAHGDDPEITRVLNWYDEDERAEWLEAGGTDAVSAFPSVTWDRPELDDLLTYPLDWFDPEYRKDPQGYTGPTRRERSIRAPGVEVERMVLWSPDVLVPLADAKVRRGRQVSAAAISWVEALAIDPETSDAEVAKDAAKAQAFLDEAVEAGMSEERRQDHQKRLDAAKAGNPIDPRKVSEFGKGDLRPVAG